MKRLLRYHNTLEENLGKHLRNLDERGETVDPHHAWRWPIQIAEGLAYIHSRGVLQADVGCHNVLLNSDEDTKICDFVGSSIDGEEPLIRYKRRYQLYTENENDQVTVETEVFAFGCTLYAVWTKKDPYEELDEEEVGENYLNARFPDLRNLPTAEVIAKCWNRDYSTMQLALDDFKRLHTMWERQQTRCRYTAFPT